MVVSLPGKQILKWMVSPLFILLSIQLINAAAYSVFVYPVDEPQLLIYAINQYQYNQNRYRVLRELVKEIEKGNVSNIYEFSTIALHVMAELFEEAASNSVKDMENREGDDRKLYRWYYTTMNYARELRRTAELITRDSSIEISNGINGELLIIIDNKPYIITSPSIKDSDQDILEHRIVDFLCQINHCPVEIQDSLFNDNKRKVVINADWSLEENKQPAFITRNGLHFVFENIKNRERKQTLCLEMITDLNLILDMLRETRQKGIIIDWDELRLEPVTGEARFKLIINTYGDAILFKLSRLTTMDALPSKIKEWFSARAEGRKYHLYLNADELFVSYLE